MKLIRAILFTAVLACTAGFNGCANDPKTSSQTPQQTVFEAKSGYAVALTAAVAYKRLPSCEKAPPPCSSKAVVQQLQKADDVAAAALDAAETAVRTPGFGDDVVRSSVTAATSALNAFVAITTSTGAK